MKNIQQRHFIQALPEEVYTALTNPFTIELWSGYPAEMSTEPGSEFTLYDGDISGKNLEFRENEMIMQQWYFEGSQADSVVTLQLKPEQNNTIVELTHTNVPDEVFEEMAEGWKKIYFNSLKLFFK